VVISTHEIYAIETKTRTKPSSKTAARWLERRLQESTGKRHFVRGVVVFPGWFVEQRGPRADVWVLEPKALPAFIENAPAMIAPSDVALAADHLARYVRSRAEKTA
jgi:hypothetical protein